MELGAFSLSTEARQGCRFIYASGELDEFTAPALAEAMGACTDELPVVVDLTSLTFINSAGLRVLLQARSAGRRAVVCPPGSVLWRLLELVSAQQTLSVFGSASAAISELGRSPAFDARSGE